MAITMATPQASAKTRPAISSCVCLLFFIIAVETVNKPALVKADYSSPPSELVFYIHLDRIPPNNTEVIVVSPSGVYNGTVIEFGNIAVITNVLRDGEAGDSTLLGQLVGQIDVAKDRSLYLAGLYELNTPRYAGSITIQGLTDGPGNGEVAITGGTGDFRWARGYNKIRLISEVSQFNVVLISTLHLKYD